jgi:hypothetical protein
MGTAGNCRLTSPPELNVNLAWHVYQGGERVTGFYPASLLLLSLGTLMLFYFAERQFQRWFPSRTASA